MEKLEELITEYQDNLSLIENQIDYLNNQKNITIGELRILKNKQYNKKYKQNYVGHAYVYDEIYTYIKSEDSYMIIRLHTKEIFIGTGHCVIYQGRKEISLEEFNKVKENLIKEYGEF